jgi:carboxyl-terminal processing protease
MLAALGDVGHTRFLSPEDLRAEQEALSGRFEGIGAHVGTRDGKPTVLAPLPGSPAERAGIRAGDVIVRVDGREVERLDTQEIVRLVRGPAGTAVTLTVLHQGDTDATDIQVTRARIESPNVVWTITPGTNVAHILLLQFAERSAQDIADALREAQARGATSIILDLRNNPGGLRDEAVGVASQFLRSGNVLLEVNADGQRTEFPVRPGGAALDIPLVVLVNEGSASSAEIVAGALQDQRRGRVIGSQTAGTGTVLSIFTLSDGSALFLGTSGWLTPDGRQIWRRGIDPDILLPLPAGALPLLPFEEERLTPEQLRDRDDAQLLRALQELGSAVPAR